MTVSVVTNEAYQGSLPNTTLVNLSISNAAGSLGCQVQVSEPDITAIGTVLLCSGKNGVEHYDTAAQGAQVILDLLAEGYRCVSRKWADPWTQSGIYTIRVKAGRFSELVDWLKASYPGPFICVGNSGGAAEICYGLSDYGFNTKLSRAVLCGGPPMSRLDWLCANPPNQPWQEKFSALCNDYAQYLDEGVIPEINCSISGAGQEVCDLLANVTPVNKKATSILHDNAVVSYPNIDLVYLLGTEDGTPAFGQGTLHFQAITANTKYLRFVPGAPHWVPTTDEGVSAIVESVLGNILGSGPVSLWE